ncbi:MAG: FecR domain-containing protein, partial [Verrucomicrobiae bacterium]|nr:FecR domain-containing protein [Verrucomicrobiae bacterium]
LSRLSRRLDDRSTARSAPDRFSRVQGVMGLAASLALLMLIALAAWWGLSRWSGAELTTLRTGAGERQTHALPDGSTVILNANSMIQYVARSPRELTLAGEAYFEVVPARSPGDHFRVKTRDGRVTVMGTRFAVYDRGAGTRVAVAEGRVAVEPFGDGPGFAGRCELTADQLVRIRAGQVPPAVERPAPHTLSWWQPTIDLDRTAFGEILNRLRETYNLDIEVSDSSLLTKTLSGRLENGDPDVILHTLATVMQVEMHRQGDQVRFDAPRR